MKAEDLMIGDWVVCNYYADKYFYKEFGIGDFLKGGYNYVDPIPLTAEILEKNGFKKFKFHDIEGQHQWTWWKDTLTNISLWCRELNDDTKDGWMIRIESPLATLCLKIEFLHQLQHALRLCGINKEIVI